MLQTPTPLSRHPTRPSLRLSPRRAASGPPIRSRGRKPSRQHGRGTGLRSPRRRFRLSATTELESARRTFHRFREFAKSRDAKRTETELQTYYEEMRHTQAELMRCIDGLNASGAISEFMFRWVISIASEAIESFSTHAQKLFAKSQTGSVITNAEYLRDFEACMTPRVRVCYGVISVGQEAVKTLVISATLIAVLRLCGADIFENFMSPVYGWRLDWCLWTLPYAIGMYFFWNSAIARRWDPLKGFKFSTRYHSFRRYVMRNPRSYHNAALLIRSLHTAWVTTLYQGLGFFIFEAIYPRLSGTGFYSLGFSMTSPVPSVVWLPVELLFLGSAAGAYHLMTDWSLIVPAEDVLKDKQRFFTMDARIAAKNFLEFHLLDDPEITRDRAIVTFLYYFATVGYLSSEAIAVHSLFASMGTLTIGHYLTFKGMQKIPL